MTTNGEDAFGGRTASSADAAAGSSRDGTVASAREGSERRPRVVTSKAVEPDVVEPDAADAASADAGAESDGVVSDAAAFDDAVLSGAASSGVAPDDVGSSEGGGYAESESDDSFGSDSGESAEFTDSPDGHDAAASPESTANTEIFVTPSPQKETDIPSFGSAAQRRRSAQALAASGRRPPSFAQRPESPAESAPLAQSEPGSESEPLTQHGSTDDLVSQEALLAAKPAEDAVSQEIPASSQPAETSNSAVSPSAVASSSPDAAATAASSSTRDPSSGPVRFAAPAQSSGSSVLTVPPESSEAAAPSDASTPITSSSATRPPLTSRQRRRLWTSTQPGAWMMVLAPGLAGTIIAAVLASRFGSSASVASGSSPSVFGVWLQDLWLLIAWALCYCVQFTAARWLVSRRVHRYLTPMLVFGGATVVVGLPFVILHPAILWWAPVYLVLAGLTLRAAYIHQERSLWANAADVLAASLIGAIAGSAAAGFRPSGIPRAAIMAAAAFLMVEYGSALFVKTMIRGFGDPRYHFLSVIWHTAMAIAAFLVQPLWGAIAVVLLMRATMLPMRSERVRPLYIGIGEGVVLSVAFVAVLVVVL
ncbi:YwiC-like family protein [uncultured Bifidobacterium sp.]|uniref:YwiC-like family protein n=1 Tax=uncultured Bifidobacterium sp. TaxID=165187 RepID=UPI0028DD3BB9|nr:YwiC-like family protein [uncultured Bifidobacterium sp.]